MIQVTLTTIEMRMAAFVGCERKLESSLSSRKNHHGMLDKSWDYDIEGAGAEEAVAKHLGKYWGGKINTFKGSDIGEKIQVRWTNKKDGRLIIRPNDDEDHWFYLVTGFMPSYNIVGYIKARYAKKPEWLEVYNQRPEAWFVPQDSLQALEEK